MKFYDSILLTMLTLFSLFEVFLTVHINKRLVKSMIKKTKNKLFKRKTRRRTKPKLKLIYQSKAVNE
jgi:hypothetical protein